MNYNYYFLLVTGLYLLSGGLIMKTENWYSSVVFKALPVILGGGTTLIAIKLLGWI